MDITVFHRDFKTQLLVIRTAGLLFSPKVFLNGVQLVRGNGGYSVHNDAGFDVTIELKTKLFNPIPTVKIDGEDVHLASSAGWVKTASLSRAG
ncbi:hypothetical protein [Sapientia aquatica]|jgi:hypothetical protein|uniref:Uncharacterized protein n=1 Tax=Sapientia aquatica TaxID=1549640 RepID=A0A4R5VWP8_9BURK|nr:hypothetical protein [Sapientia aquatica]TDK62725.1 hypothetical protein E2I14_15570 [Sapientia aquatica]